MVRLAMHGNGEPANKQQIAKAEGISAHYVEQILSKLRAADLVASHRGTKGGFSIVRSPDAITVMDILRAADGPIALAPCTDSRCKRITICATHPVWREAAAALEKVFLGTTLSDLAKKARAIGSHAAASYEI
jgi:Rrf2 family protein